MLKASCSIKSLQIKNGMMKGPLGITQNSTVNPPPPKYPCCQVLPGNSQSVKKKEVPENSILGTAILGKERHSSRT